MTYDLVIRNGRVIDTAAGIDDRVRCCYHRRKGGGGGRGDPRWRMPPRSSMRPENW